MMHIPPQVMAQVAANGSPELLSSFGRLFGFGNAEQQALVKGEFPRWSFFALGAALGIAAGIAVQRRYPETIRKIVGV